MLELVIWDVQHGSAAYINTPNGKVIIIDLGTGDLSGYDEEFSPLEFLRERGVNIIDQLIITHPHTDHIDDIFNLDNFNVSKLIRPPYLDEKEIRAANKAQDKPKVDKYIELNSLFKGIVSDQNNVLLAKNNGGVNIDYFVPWKCMASNVNNLSIVTIIEYLGVKIAIPGDNEAASWNELLELKDFISAIKGTHVYIASHHGRDSGYSAELFKYFSPNLVIVSDGKSTATSSTSKYSAIAQGWEVLSRSGAPSEERYCLTTRKDGTITIQVYEKRGQTYLDIYKE